MPSAADSVNTCRARRRAVPRTPQAATGDRQCGPHLSAHRNGHTDMLALIIAALAAVLALPGAVLVALQLKDRRRPPVKPPEPNDWAWPRRD
jgi:hypothetical protein